MTWFGRMLCGLGVHVWLLYAPPHWFPEIQFERCVRCGLPRRARIRFEVRKP